MNDQDLVYRLRNRAEIRRQIQSRKSVHEGKPDRIADLLEEAADEIERLQAKDITDLRTRLERINLFTEQNIEDAIKWVRNLPSGGDYVWDGKDEDDRPLTREEMQKGVEKYRISKELGGMLFKEGRQPVPIEDMNIMKCASDRTWAERNAADLAAHGRDIARTGLAGAEFDPMNSDSVNSFLEFLANDVETHPEHVQSIDAGLVDRIRKLVGNIKVDLDVPLPVEREINHDDYEIRNDEELQAAFRRLEKVFQSVKGTQADAEMQRLVTLIEAYENKYFPFK